MRLSRLCLLGSCRRTKNVWWLARLITKHDESRCVWKMSLLLETPRDTSAQQEGMRLSPYLGWEGRQGALSCIRFRTTIGRPYDYHMQLIDHCFIINSLKIRTHSLDSREQRLSSNPHPRISTPIHIFATCISNTEKKQPFVQPLLRPQLPARIPAADTLSAASLPRTTNLPLPLELASFSQCHFHRHLDARWFA